MARSGDGKSRSRTALIAAGFFALGLLAARLLGWLSPGGAPSGGAAPSASPPSEQAASPTTNAPRPPPLIADAGGPRIIFDPSSIVLLPDASLEIDPPAPPDAGSSTP